MMNGMNGSPAVLYAVVLCSIGCGSFREVAPPPGTSTARPEVERGFVRRELEIGGTRDSNWVSAGERWAEDLGRLLEELREETRDDAVVLGLAATINESGLPTASFLPLHHQLVRTLRAAAQRQGLTIQTGVVPGEPNSVRLDGLVIPRVIGEVRSGDAFTLSYELRLSRKL